MGERRAARRGIASDDGAMHGVAWSREVGVSPASARRPAGGEDQFLIVELASDGLAAQCVESQGDAWERLGFPGLHHVGLTEMGASS